MTQSLMSDFEMDVAGDIMLFAFNYFKGKEPVSQEEMVTTYWKEYFEGCQMKDPVDGFEVIDESVRQDYIFYYPENNMSI